MTKKLFILVILLFVSIPVFAQVDKAWVKSYKDTGNDHSQTGALELYGDSRSADDLVQPQCFSQSNTLGGTEVMSWKWDSLASVWVLSGSPWPNPDTTAPGRAFSSLPDDRYCYSWPLQRIEWAVTGAKWEWWVREPGIYCADCITFYVASSDSVSFDFEGFDNLKSENASVDSVVRIFYVTGDYAEPPSPDDPDWIPADSLNLLDPLLEYSEQLEYGIFFKLWNMIKVGEQVPFCKFVDTSLINILTKGTCSMSHEAYLQVNYRPVIPERWKTSGNLASCEGPADSTGNYWYDSDFDDEGWYSVSLPDYGWACDSCDRFYRYFYHYPTMDSTVYLDLMSDNGLWLYVNGAFVGHWGGDCHEGGCVNDTTCSWYDSLPPVDITPFLVVGYNIVAAHISDAWVTEFFDASIFTVPVTPTGVIAGQVSDSIGGVERALIEILQNEEVRYSEVTDADGSFSVSELLPGTFDARVTKYGYVSETMQDVQVVEYETTTVDFDLTLAFRPVIPLQPDANPSVSTVMDAGTAHRYYKVIDHTGNPQAHKWVGVGGTFYVSGEDGIVDVVFPWLFFPNYDPVSLTITHLEDDPLGPSQRLQFVVQRQPRTYERYIAYDASVHGSLFKWGGLLEKALIMGLRGDRHNPDTNFVDQNSELGVQLGAGIGIGASLTINEINAGAYGGVGIYAGAGLFQQYTYDFTFPISSSDQSLAELIVITDPLSFVPQTPEITRLFQGLVTFLSPNVGQILEEGYTFGGNGIDIYAGGGAKGVIDSDVLPGGVSSLVDVQASASIGAEEHIKFGIFEDLLNNREQMKLEVLGKVSASGACAFNFDVSWWYAPGSYSSDLPFWMQIWNGQFLYEGYLSGSVAFLFDDQGRNWILVSSRIDPFNFAGDLDSLWEYNLLIETTDNSLYDVIMNLTPNTESLYEMIVNAGAQEFNIKTSSNTFALILFKIFDKVGEMQANAEPINVHYEVYLEESQTTQPLIFDLSAAGGVSGNVGAEGKVHKVRRVLLEKGTRVLGKNYPNEEYTRDWFTDVVDDAEEITSQLILNLIPTGILEQIYEVFVEVVEWGVVTVVEMGNSWLEIPANAVSAGMEVGGAVWGWWGSSPSIKASSLPPDQFRLYSRIKEILQELHNLRYGIGGFYDLIPEGLILDSVAQLTIAYEDSDVVGIDENTLAMYFWDDSTMTWKYHGGIRDTAANTVTDTIRVFRLYTLAPTMPAQEFNLYPQPESLYADTLNSCLVVSDSIYNNDGSVVSDGTKLTVATDGGTITTPDVDPGLEGIQITSVSGKISFEIQSPSIGWIAHITAKSIDGWAFGETVVTFIDTAAPSAPQGLFWWATDSTITLYWDNNAEVDLAGYRVYYDSDTSGAPYNGTSPFDTPSPIDVGLSTERTIYGLAEGAQYYIALTAYDISGNESQFSQEIVAIPGTYLRGDANGDGVIDLGDVVYLINYLYRNGSAPDPLEVGDCNCDGIVDLGDVVYLINYLYRGGPPPCR